MLNFNPQFLPDDLSLGTNKEMSMEYLNKALAVSNCTTTVNQMKKGTAYLNLNRKAHNMRAKSNTYI